MGYGVNTQKEDIRKVINVSPQETAVAINLTVLENMNLIAGVWDKFDDINRLCI